MNSRFLSLFPVLYYVFFLHISLVQLLAFNTETGINVTTVKFIERERQALLSLKQGFQPEKQAFQLKKDWLSSWGDGENQKECCNWEGIQCSNETGHVSKLDLHADDYVAVSSISPSLGELRRLNYLDLSYLIPLNRPLIADVIGSLTHLRHLNLSHCGFQEKMPHELGNLLFLEYLDLQKNGLEGQIPSQFSNLSHLVYLDLSWNYLDGNIPPQVVTNMSLLRYMDLSCNEFNGTMPPQLGNLLSLEYLDLRFNPFTGTIPLHFGNLSNLQYFDSSFYDETSLSSDLQWVSHLSSLRHLSLFAVNLSNANSWQRLVSGLSHLQYLDFHGCNLIDSIPSSLSSAANFSTSLSFVDISDNHLMNSSLVFPWLMNSTHSLSILRMKNNGLKGTIPEAFGDLSSLKQLNLANNMLEGQIPISLFHSCNLIKLGLSRNRLTGQFHEFVQAFSRCAHRPLRTLNMGWNEITGIVPDLSQLSYLQVLLLGNNKLSGNIHEGIGQLSHLVKLSLTNNKLEGLISEVHFLRLSNLSTLDLSHNALVFDVSTEWIPPFSLSDINLASCILGPHFPRWLQTQKDIELLDISLAEISDSVPNWFWELLPVMTKVNLSHNHIRGKIENLPLEIGVINFQIDLTSNLFEGQFQLFFQKRHNCFCQTTHFQQQNFFYVQTASKM